MLKQKVLSKSTYSTFGLLLDIYCCTMLYPNTSFTYFTSQYTASLVVVKERHFRASGRIDHVGIQRADVQDHAIQMGRPWAKIKGEHV